ncbi:MAG: Sec-independent protein translocase protein TatB [Hyphomicrobiales bacterium]
MFDIGAVELMVIAIVAIIVVGPKDLPGMLRTFGQFVGKMRRMAREFQDTFEEAAKDTGLDDIAKGVSDVKNMSVAGQVGKVFDPIAKETDSIKSEIEKAGQISDNPSAKKTLEEVSSSKPAKPKKAAPKKATKAAKKPAAKKAPAKKAPVKKTPAKKTPAKQTAAKKSPAQAKSTKSPSKADG